MRKSVKLGVALAVIAAGGVLAFVGAAPEGFRSVTDVATEPTAFVDRDVQVKATVVAGSVDRTNGSLTFRVQDDRTTLLVAWSGDRAVPEHEAGGTIEGRTVVLTGRISPDGDLRFVATDMQVGCASKYEPVDA